eukprot:g2034.t1
MKRNMFFLISLLPFILLEFRYAAIALSIRGRDTLPHEQQILAAMNPFGSGLNDSSEESLQVLAASDGFKPVECVDVRWTPEGEAQLLCTGINGAEGTSTQRWMMRGEVCRINDDAVLEFFEWYNGDPSEKDVCCVRDLSVSASNDPKMDTAAQSCAAAHGDASNDPIFVGLTGNHYSCPRGYRPLRDKGVDLKGSCCSFFGAEKSNAVQMAEDVSAANDQPAPVSARGKCGHRNCLTLIETAYCEPIAPRGGAGTIGSAYYGGSRDFEGPSDSLAGEAEPMPHSKENRCGVGLDLDSQDHLKQLSEAEKEQNCEKLDVAVRNSEKSLPLGDRCTWCRRFSTSTVTKTLLPTGGMCAPCHEVHSLMMSGEFLCFSFGGDYPCGALPPSATLRISQRKIPQSWPSEYNGVTAEGRWGVMAQGDHVVDTPYIHKPALFRSPGMQLGASTGSEVRQYAVSGHGSGPIGAGMCPVTKLTIHKGKNELEQIGEKENNSSLEDLLSSQSAMKQVLEHIGNDAGVHSVQSLMYPTMYSTAVLSNPSALQFRDASSWYFGCSDSHATFPIMGAPGGDVGEFLLGLTTLQKMRGIRYGGASNPLSKEEVSILFQQYLATMTEKQGKEIFFACTNVHTLAAWGKAATSSEPLRPRGNAESNRLIATAGLPQFVGSKFLQTVMTSAKEFESSYEIAHHLMQTLMEIYYDASHPSRGRLLVMESGGSDHFEAALFVNKVGEYPCGDQSPLVVPFAPDSDRAFFVVHSGAQAIHRNHLSKFFIEEGHLVGHGVIDSDSNNIERNLRIGKVSETVAAFEKEMNRVGDKQLELMLKRFGNIPKFRASFRAPSVDYPTHAANAMIGNVGFNQYNRPLNHVHLP